MNSLEDSHLQSSHKIVLEIAEKIKPVIENPLKIASQELALNLKVLLHGKGPLNSQDSESYRELIIGLNEKLKVLQITLERLDYACNLNAQLLKEKEQREISHQQALKELEKLLRQQAEKCLEYEKAKNQAFQDLKDLRNQLQNQQLKQDELEIEIDRLQSELEKEKTLNQTLLGNNGQNGLGENDPFADEFKRMKQALAESLGKFDQMSEEMKKEFEKMDEEKAQLQKQLEEAERDAKGLKNSENQLKSENAKLQNEIDLRDGQLKAMEELEANYKTMKNVTDNLKSQNELYQSSIKTLTSDNRSLASELNSTKEKTNNQIQALNSKLLQQEAQNKAASSKIKDLEGNLNSQNHENSLMAKKLNQANSSMRNAFEEISKMQKEADESRQKTQSELEFIANYTLKTSQDHLEQERSMKKLSEIVSEKDSELMILREMVSELQKAKPPVYFAAKDDPVDQALADYINSRPEPMEVNFIREDNGTYLFGSKRVFIKIENGKIISND